VKKIISVIAILATVILISCGDAGVDVVNDITPVHNWSPEKQAILDSLKNIPVTNRQQFLSANWPSLSADLVLFLKGRNKIERTAQIDSIVYKYGDAEGVKAEDASGKVHEGYFKNQLVAFIYIANRQKPLAILVSCVNGGFQLPEDLEYVKRDTKFEFTIEKTRGIAYYVGSNETAIYLAEFFGRPLYEGKGINKKRLITPAQARQINTNELQITVLVYTGDYFNLNTMEYRPARQPNVRYPVY